MNALEPAPTPVTGTVVAPAATGGATLHGTGALAATYAEDLLLGTVRDTHLAIANRNAGRQRGVPLANRARDDLIRIDQQAGMPKVGHRAHAGELPLVQRDDVREAQPRRRAARAAIRLAYGIDPFLIPARSRMPRFAARQRLGQHVPRAVRVLGRELVDRFDLALELEAVILDAAPNHQRRATAVRVVHHLAFRHRCELTGGPGAVEASGPVCP